MAPVGAEGSGRGLCRTSQGTLTSNTTSFTLAHATPNTKLLAVGQGVLKTVAAYDATPAHLLGLTGRCPSLGKEQIGVNSKAVGQVLPGTLYGNLDGCGSHASFLLCDRCPAHLNVACRRAGKVVTSPTSGPETPCRGRCHTRRCNYNTVIMTPITLSMQGKINKYAVICAMSPGDVHRRTLLEIRPHVQ